MLISYRCQPTGDRVVGHLKDVDGHLIAPVSQGARMKRWLPSQAG